MKGGNLLVPNTYIFDCEVFAHDWLFVFKEVATGRYTIIHNDNDAVLAFMEQEPYLGGFNNKHYDNHIPVSYTHLVLLFCMMGKLTIPR